MALHAGRLLKPQILLPILLATALLAFAASLGDIGRVAAGVTRLSVSTLVAALIAAAAYLLVKAFQLNLLLKRLGFRVDRGPFWLAFTVGELSVTLPLGLFAQNWILAAAHQADAVRSSAATVMMVIGEILVTFLFLACVGIPAWPQLRLAAIAVLAVMAVGLLTVPLLAQHLERFATHLRHRWIRRSVGGGLTLLGSMRELTNPFVLCAIIGLTALYLGALSFAFWVTGRDVAVTHLGYIDATLIYAFSLAIILVGAGLLSQIGTTEVLGMVAAHSLGIGFSDSLALMLGFRIVWTACIWALCLPVIGLTWRSIPRRAASSRVDDREKVTH
ncbi:MAG TPA: lysylphosphatidylglycerol synthase domain-containing protein [Nevskiaceae bacterium]